VADLAVAIGEELQVDEETLSVLAHAGLLHDLGKLGISDRILHKPGALNAEEWAIMRQHPSLGLEVLERIGGLEGVKEVVWSHHERLDGSGYPRHLTEAAIPIAVRIIALADTYDSITSDRPYRTGVGTEAALAIIHTECEHTLDAECVAVLERVVKQDDNLYLPALAALPFFTDERRVGVTNRRWQGPTERRLRSAPPSTEID
jgi:HD-GYP domain-containing protein (c-di-GMP phosphodiesterase class II)